MKKHILFVGFLIFCSSCGQYITQKEEVYGQNIRMNEKVAESDPSVEAMIAPYKEKLDDEMNEIVAISNVDLIKSSPESTMGNWFADLLMEESLLMDERVSFVIQNRGGLRIGNIKKGEITKGKIFELMPFDNFLVIMETNGATMQSFIEHTAKDRGWPMSKEIRVSMQDTVVQSILISGEPINPDAIYFYAVPDYVANGGSNSAMLKGQKQLNSGIMIRDLAIRHLRKKHQQGEKIDVKIDGRFSVNQSK